jgi:hypothetical protein
MNTACPPFRGVPGAPAFDGNPFHLNRFFTDIDNMYKAIGSTPSDEDKITQTKLYLDVDTSDIWDTFTPPAGAAQFTWDTFKQTVKTFYPGSDGNRLYSVTDLERYVLDSATKGIFTRGDLGEYLREFARISSHLKSQNRIDDRGIDRLFICGFGDATRRRIEHRLSIIQPDHHPDDVYAMATVQKAAEFLLSSTSSLTAPTGGLSSSVSGRSASPPKEIKTETPAPTDLSTLVAALSTSVAAAVAKALNQPRSTRPSTSAPTANASPQNNYGCHFCGEDGCRIGKCPVVEEYCRAGKLMRNAAGKVTLPDGKFVPNSYPGSNLRERVDKYYAANPVPTNYNSTVPTNMVRTMRYIAAPPRQTAYIEEVTDESDPEQDSVTLLARVLANEATRKGKAKRGQPAAQQTEQDTSPDEAEQPVASSSKPVDPAGSPAKAPAKNEPQYHYQAPCEDSEVAHRVFQRVMNNTFHISTRELLAVSADTRKRLKDFTTQKRVPVSLTTYQPDGKSATVLFNRQTQEQPLIVARVSEPLCSVTGILNDNISAECVLDNGSGIVCMNQAVWKKTGAPLRSDLIMEMEASNGQKNFTLGALVDFPIKIGNVSFFLQIQVTKDLPCDILLGRTFFSLTAAQTIDYADGDQDVILRDPNSNEEITVPTFAHQPGSRTVQPDF